MSEFSKSELFKRQTTLAEFGEVGQQKLQAARVLVVGCGGLGSPIAVYLASAGIGQLHLVDFDTIDVSNLHRQVFYDIKDVGLSKAEVLADKIRSKAPYTEVHYSTKALVKDDAMDLIQGFDIVVDGTDSLPTKYLLNDCCVMLGIPLVYGSLYKFDGYVASFNVRQEDGSYSANLRDAFPEISTDVPNCETAGTLNPVVGMIAMAQVNEVIKLIAGIGQPIVNQLQIYNALYNTKTAMKLSAKFGKDAIADLFKNESYFDAACGTQNPVWQISPKALREQLGNSNLELVAVLPNLQLPFKVHQTIPIQEFDAATFDIHPEKTYVMVCQKGRNSYKATQQLREKYPDINVLNLTGGIEAYH